MGQMKNLQIEIDNMIREVPKSERWAEIFMAANLHTEGKTNKKDTEIFLITSALLAELEYVLDATDTRGGEDAETATNEQRSDPTIQGEAPDLPF